MDVNDRYILEITSSAKGLDKVAGNLERLKTSLKGFSFPESKVTALNNFSSGISALGKATSSIDTGKIIAFSTALKQLSDVKVKLPKGMDETIKNIEKAFTGLGDSKELYKKVNSFSRIMQPLSDLKFGGIKGAGDAVKGLEKALGGLDFRKVHGQVDAIARILEPLTKVDSGKLSAVASALKQIGNAKVQNLQGIDKSIEGIQKAIAGLDAKEFYKKADGLFRIVKPLSDLKFGGVKGASESLTNLQTTLGSLDFRKIHGEAEALNRILEPLANTMDKLAKASISVGLNKSMGKGIGNAYQGLAQVLNGTVNRERAGGAEKETTSLADRFGELKTKAQVAFTAIVQGAKRVASAMKSIAGVVGKVVVAISNISFLNPFKGVANSVQNVIKKLNKLGSSLARIAMYRALRSAIKEVAKAVREGLENLYQWSKATGGDFAPAVDKLATAFLYLKNSIGASVSPLITYFAPAIDLAVDKIVELINVVNQLFARLTGRATWTRALKYPTEFAEKAGGATKKVKDNIQDFDELHILRTPSGGGGASADDYSKMFEETEFTQGLTDWIENLKDAIRAGRWYEAGNIIADEINKVINNINWGKLGANLGDKVTYMFQFAFGLLKNIDFVNIGSSIATFLNNAIDHIDTELVGMTFARKWTAIIDFLYGFVTTFDFPAFGWKISEFVQGWFEELDGNRIGTTISEAIKGVLDMAISFMSNDAMWTEFVEDIAGILNNIDWYGILTRVLTLGSKIISAIGTVIRTAIMGGQDASTSIADSYYQAISRQAGSSSVASRITSEMRSANGYTSTFGDQLVGALADSVTNANSEPLVNGIQRLLEALGKVLVDLVKSLGKTVGEKFWENFFDAVQGWHYDEEGNKVSAEDHFSIGGATREGSTEVVEDTVEDVQSFVNTIWNKINGDYNEATAWGATGISGFQQVWNATMVKNAQRSVKAYNNTLSKTGTIIRSVGTDGKKSFDALNSSIKDFSVTSKNGLASVTDSAVLFGDKMSNDVVSKVMQSKNAISATITSLSEDTKFRMSDMTNTVISSIDNADKAIVTPMANIKNTITNGFKDAGTESVGAIKDMGNNMKGALDGVINSSRDSVKGYKDIWDGLHSTVKNTSNSVIAGAESMGNGVTTAFNQIIRNLKNFKVTIPNIGDNKDAGKQFNFEHLQEIQKISIPRLATGGIITSPTTALIGEAGKEAVVPLENNTGWMDALAERIGADGEEIAILREQNDLLRQIASKNVTISSRDVFNAVRDENADYITMTGKNALVM